MTATVKWFNDRKGFGFAETPDGKSVFCHYSDVEATGYKSLKEDDVIVFDLYEDTPGFYKARNIKLKE